MPEVEVAAAIAQFGREAWDAVFPGEVEAYDYLSAIEASGLPGFRWRYLGVRETGRLVAAAPAFLTDYPLETTLEGAPRRLLAAARRMAPDLLTLRLACLGSPCVETASAGFHPQVPAGERPRLAQRLLEGLAAEAQRARCTLLGLKDVAAPDQGLWDAAARPLGFRPLPGQPVADLDIDFADLDAYLARLSPGVRRDMRRKLRSLGAVRIEVRETLDGLLDRVSALYAETRARAEMQFEELTPAYFSEVLRRMPGRAFAVLYFQGEDLLAVNLLLQDHGVLLDKFFCMEAARGRPLNLYFLSWFTNVRLCLERGLTRYRSGQAAYETKLKLGSRLTRTSLYFRHRHPVVNGALRLAAPLFGADPTQRRAA
ncbi:GNAT family N-acetyltransferase [Phenylobacterium sp.]|uniref:GNAT family N-acetyltransferase n=1 Tax=Phenylobacterium sp. TaxID=1871053 RepID=UPI002F3E731E